MKYIIFSFSLCMTVQLQGQSFFNNLDLSLTFGIEQHDKRMFDLNIADHILNAEDDNGSIYYSISVAKNYGIMNNIEVSASLGYARHISTFSRPYDWGKLTRNTHGPFIYFLVDKYRKDLIISQLNLKFIPTQNTGYRIGATTSFEPSIVFRKSIGDKGTYESLGVFDFYNFQIVPGLWLSYKGFALSIGYRAYNLQQIDEILFFPLIFDDNDHNMLSRKTEEYNPTKITFTLSYRIGKKHSEEEILE